MGQVERHSYTDVLVDDDKIVKVGQNIDAPDAKVISGVVKP